MGALTRKLDARTVSLTRSLDRARAQAREANERAESSLTPAQVTMYVQLGAACGGALRASFGRERSLTALLASAAAGLGGGSVLGSAELVAAGNGVLAAITAEQVEAIMTRRREYRDVREPRLVEEPEEQPRKRRRNGAGE